MSLGFHRPPLDDVRGVWGAALSLGFHRPPLDDVRGGWETTDSTAQHREVAGPKHSSCAAGQRGVPLVLRAGGAWGPPPQETRPTHGLRAEPDGAAWVDASWERALCALRTQRKGHSTRTRTHTHTHSTPALRKSPPNVRRRGEGASGAPPPPPLEPRGSCCLLLPAAACCWGRGWGGGWVGRRRREATLPGWLPPPRSS